MMQNNNRGFSIPVLMQVRERLSRLNRGNFKIQCDEMAHDMAKSIFTDL
jgi:hypothetical protein